jgi:hypothetical protein
MHWERAELLACNIPAVVGGGTTQEIFLCSNNLPSSSTEIEHVKFPGDRLLNVKSVLLEYDWTISEMPPPFPVTLIRSCSMPTQSLTTTIKDNPSDDDELEPASTIKLGTEIKFITILISLARVHLNHAIAKQSGYGKRDYSVHCTLLYVAFYSYECCKNKSKC